MRCRQTHRIIVSSRLMEALGLRSTCLIATAIGGEDLLPPVCVIALRPTTPATEPKLPRIKIRPFILTHGTASGKFPKFLIKYIIFNYLYDINVELINRARGK
jgi:hypothetical protein